MDPFFWFMSAHHVAVAAGIFSEDGVHPRYLNISDLSSPASSSPLDPASFSSPDPASTLLPQAPAGYCGLCVIEAPGGIRLVYWVCVLSEQICLCFEPFSKSQYKSQEPQMLSVPSWHFIALILGP